MSKRKVLVPLDRTDFSWQILPILNGLIEAEETEILLFSVIDPLKDLDNTVTSMITFDVQRDKHKTSELIKEKLWADVEAKLETQIEHLKHVGYQASFNISVGNPAEEILQAIAHDEFDLIAMTTHAREGLHRIFSGSVAEKVLHHINIPILLYHPPEQVLSREEEAQPEVVRA